MKLLGPYVPPEKLTHYLLMPRAKGDKSQYLALAGFTLRNASALQKALLDIAATEDATEDRQSDWGTTYRVEGELAGPNGKFLPVVTIWMAVPVVNRTRFVTLFPPRKE
jgi:hypothetical protein